MEWTWTSWSGEILQLDMLRDCWGRWHDWSGCMGDSCHDRRPLFDLAGRGVTWCVCCSQLSSLSGLILLKQRGCVQHADVAVASRPRTKMDTERVVYCGIERCFFEVSVRNGIFHYTMSKRKVTTDSSRDSPPFPPNVSAILASARAGLSRGGSSVDRVAALSKAPSAPPAPTQPRGTRDLDALAPLPIIHEPAGPALPDRLPLYTGSLPVVAGTVPALATVPELVLSSPSQTAGLSRAESARTADCDRVLSAPLSLLSLQLQGAAEVRLLRCQCEDHLDKVAAFVLTAAWGCQSIVLVCRRHKMEVLTGMKGASRRSCRIALQAAFMSPPKLSPLRVPADSIRAPRMRLCLRPCPWGRWNGPTSRARHARRRRRRSGHRVSQCRTTLLRIGEAGLVKLVTLVTPVRSSLRVAMRRWWTGGVVAGEPQAAPCSFGSTA
jgi:hypothetical protein